MDVDLGQEPLPTSPTAHTPWRANWIVVLFALPFVGCGLHLIAMGLRGLLGEDPKIAGEWGKRPCYEVRIHRTGARLLKSGDGMRSKHETEWLCAALLRAAQGSFVDAPLAESSRGR